VNKNILKGIIVVLFIIGFGLCICCFLVESNDKKGIPTSNVFKDEKIELSSEFYNYDIKNDYKGTDIGNYEGISISDGMWPGYDPSDDRTMEQYDKDIEKAIELKAELINKLIKEKKSFIVTVQNASVCTANSYSLDLNTTKFCNDNNIYCFLMGTDVFFKTDLHKTVKYAPTTIIVKEGEVYKYTDPNSDEYIDFDKDYEKVKEWLEKYIVIK
jgi:hypothetical protein